MSAQAYAKVAPYARHVIRLLLKPESLREMTEATSLAEALTALPENLYPGLREARTRREAEIAVWRGYLDVVSKAVKLSPKHSRTAIGLYRLLEEARDVLVLAEASRAGRALEALERLPTAQVEGSPLAELKGEVEALQSPQRLAEAVEDKFLRGVLESAISFEQRAGVPGALLFYYAPFTARAASEAIASLPSMERGLYSRVTCPRILYIVVAGLVGAKDRGLDARLLDEAFQGVSVCGLKWGDVRTVYEREPDPQSLASSLSHLIPGWRVEGSVAEILESARRASRLESRRRALNAIASYPFQAGFVVAVLELARLEAEDLTSLIGALSLRLKKEEYAPRLSVQIA
ncbi:MAG: V-type ATPase subunit [Desulfurococcales archaeon]|nr:V-type ATPase subunit [Desulfurococcales archaeon]